MIAPASPALPDLRVENHGSIITIDPVTPAGKVWLEQNVESEGWQWFGPMLCVEPRYALPLLCAAYDAGLVVA